MDGRMVGGCEKAARSALVAAAMGISLTKRGKKREAKVAQKKKGGQERRGGAKKEREGTTEVPLKPPPFWRLPLLQRYVK